MTTAVKPELAGDVVVAATIEDRHRDGRRCDDCGPAGCELVDWSRPLLAAHRAERAWS